MAKLDEITRIRKIAEPLAKKHLWYDLSQSDLDRLFEDCRSYADKLERVKRIAPDEAFQESYQAIIDKLKGEIAWDWEQYQCYDRNNLQRDGKNPWEGNYRSKLFINGTILAYLESIFSDHPKGKEQGPPAPSFGEGLATVVRDALEKRRLLDGGKFAGQTSPHVKALFAVLRQKGYLPKKSRIQAARMLSSLFASEFGFEFAARTISTAETQKSLGQEKAETQFLKDIPEKK